MVWVDETTFVAPKSGLFAAVERSLGGDLFEPLRLAAALDHNCPLEGVAVVATSESAGTHARFRVEVCGEARDYLRYPGSGFIDVTRTATPEPAKAPPSDDQPADEKATDTRKETK